MALRERVRVAVFERDNYRCRYCGKRYKDRATGEGLSSYFDDAPRWCGGPRWRALLHVDHVIPRCKGGADDLANLVTACVKCNLAKYDNVWEPISLEALS